MRVEIAGFAVSLERKKIKNLYLRIQSSAELLVTAPQKMPLADIHAFISQKRPWIEKQHQRLLQEQVAAESEEDTVAFLGQRYPLRCLESTGKFAVELAEQELRLYLKPGASSAEKTALINRWYLQEMQKRIPALFDKWQAAMGLTVNRISIKRMRSRWGSCQPIRKHITLNLRLMEKPLSCLEYVIVHELVHLFEASHNQRFHALVTHYLPNWKVIKKLLV